MATYFSDRGKTLLIDSDQNRTAVAWAKLGKLPFDVKDEKSSIKAIAGNDYIIVDTPARPESNDLKELASNGDLLVLPTTPDVVSLRPAILTTKDIPKGAKYRVLLTIVPPYPSKEGVTVQQDLRCWFARITSITMLLLRCEKPRRHNLLLNNVPVKL